jgi:hypothetical protein
VKPSARALVIATVSAVLLASCSTSPSPQAADRSVLQQEVAELTAAAARADMPGARSLLATVTSEAAAQRASGVINASSYAEIQAALAAVARDVAGTSTSAPTALPAPTPTPTVSHSASLPVPQPTQTLAARASASPSNPRTAAPIVTKAIKPTKTKSKGHGHGNGNGNGG